MILPGDKSLSHRVAMLAAIADGPCHIRNFSTGADCASTVNCLRALGSEIHPNLEIIPRILRSPADPLDCGNSGSTIRMLTGMLAGLNVPATLTGDESLLRRPMSRVAEPLRAMGAVIDLRGGNYAPVELREGAKRAIQYQSPVSSAQVKSAVLFAGLRFAGTSVIERAPSRDHTERLLAHLGVVSGPGCKVPAFEYDVPGDPSSAAFFVAAAILRGTSLKIQNVLVNPFRIGFVRLLQKSGARIQLQNQRLLQNEPVADLVVEPGGDLHRLLIQPGDVPALIDEIPALAIIATRCGIDVSGAGELRYKESDRIRALISNLDSLGIQAVEKPDGFRVEPGTIQGGIAKTFGDHRIAMAFSAAGVEVDDRDCVRISFPEFYDLLLSL